MLGMRSFPFGCWPIFRCELLVVGRVKDCLHSLSFMNCIHIFQFLGFNNSCFLCGTNQSFNIFTSPWKKTSQYFLVNLQQPAGGKNSPSVGVPLQLVMSTCQHPSTQISAQNVVKPSKNGCCCKKYSLTCAGSSQHLHATSFASWCKVFWKLNCQWYKKYCQKLWKTHYTHMYAVDLSLKIMISSGEILSTKLIT